MAVFERRRRGDVREAGHKPPHPRPRGLRAAASLRSSSSPDPEIDPRRPELELVANGSGEGWAARPGVLAGGGRARAWPAAGALPAARTGVA
jgi:hypothetical protein